MHRRAPRLRPTLDQLEGRDLPTFYGNQLFPLDNPWNQRIADAPVAANSAAIMSRIVSRSGNRGIHPDFGNPLTDGALYGIPINVVDGSTPKVNVTISATDGYPGESDVVQVPIPLTAVIEGDGATGPSGSSARGDSHLLIYDKTANLLYELYNATRPTETTFPYGGAKPLGTWGAYQVSFWDLNTNAFRTLGWTSADAAGLPIMPGLLRPDEALPPAAGGQGAITHAIRVTVVQTRNEYVYPASHVASNRPDADLPRMGERFRLRPDFVIPASWSPAAKATAQAMKDYGLIVADNGSDFYFQGVPSTDWDMDAMLKLGGIKVSDFQVVDLKPVVSGLNVTAGATGGGTAVSIFGKNFGGAAGNLHVTFGGVEAPAFTIVSDSRIDVTAPPHPAGRVDVRVQSGSARRDADNDPVFFGYGISDTLAADQFTFSDAINPPPTSPSPPSPPNLPPSPPSPPTIPPTTPPGHDAFAVGVGTTLQYRGSDAGLAWSLTPFPDLPVEVRTATGDFNRDGVPDVVAATGPGAASRVRILDGRDSHELFAVAPFEAAFTGGVYVTTGDLDGDGVADLVVTPDEGGGPRVDVYSGAGFGKSMSFYGIDDPNFRGGARASTGDLNADGRADLIVVAGFGGGPRVAAFDGRSLAATPRKVFGDFFAFEQSLRNGVFVTAGDVNGDGYADLIAGGGPGGGPRVLVLDGRRLLANDPLPLANFFAGDASGRGGVRVSTKDLDGDGLADLVVGAGADGGSRVTAYLGKGISGGQPAEGFDFDADVSSHDGVFVG